jgi:uncharacterized protein
VNLVWIAFITGLTTGGLSCLAVQGGLLASSLAHQKNHIRAISFFLLAKLLAYTFLGITLGFLGSFFTLTPYFQGVLQILAGLFMLLTAAQLLKLHPYLRFLVVHPPKWVYKLTIKESEKNSSITPFILGFLTILIPCGTTQAMMALAISSGSYLTGAEVLSAFTLGTIPIFLVLGVASSTLLKNKLFSFVAAFCIAYLGIVSINTGQVLRGSFYTFQHIYEAATLDDSKILGAKVMSPVIANGEQEVTIDVSNNGYKTSANVLKAGIPVKLILASKDVVNCVRDFVIPSLNMSKLLPETGTTIVEFTPTKTGPLSYSCGMGMYGGQFTVIN